MKHYFFQNPSRTTQFIVSLTVVALVTILGLLTYTVIGYRVPAFLLLVSVSFLAMWFDIVPVVAAATLSALAWDFLFIPPRFTFTVGNTEDRWLLLMYFLIALINAALTFKIRSMQKEIRVREERANSLKLYNVIFNSLSHELRTPITTILGATDNLQSNASRLNEATREELLEEVSQASLRLNQQVENLLSMSRLESGVFRIKKDWCDVHELIYTVLNRLDGPLREHPVTVAVPDSFPLFKLDIGLMEQVLHNLISNAITHTPPGTRITLTASATGNTLRLTIADTGEGFPTDEIEKVFDKFYRLQRSRTGGTGLGLSIVKGFVEAHQGTITLQNLPQRGAQFTIEIPTEVSTVTDTAS